EENNDFEDYDFFEDEIDEKIDKLFETCVKKSVNSIKKMWTPMKKDSSSQEVAKTANDLSGLTNDLQEEISKFKVK
ncbi:hypothetical protein AAGC94_17130, partial [Clostridium sporogenes]